MVGVRMGEDLQEEIRTWAEKQDDDPPLATAIRQLVEIGLKAKSKKLIPNAGIVRI